MKKVGLYGGTFNPIHVGHLNLAFELMEKGGLDEVWWIPTSRSPLRGSELQVDAEARCQMVRLAIEEIPQFKVVEIEIAKPPPAYTVETVLELVNAYPDVHFSLLLAEEVLENFLAWKNPLELIRLVPLLIGGRQGTSLPLFPEEIQKAIEAGRVETALFDVSATQVRERLKNNLYVGHLIPAKVLDFICVNQLYFTA